MSSRNTRHKKIINKSPPLLRVSESENNLNPSANPFAANAAAPRAGAGGNSRNRGNTFASGETIEDEVPASLVSSRSGSYNTQLSTASANIPKPNVNLNRYILNNYLNKNLTVAAAEAQEAKRLGLNVETYRRVQKHEAEKARRNAFKKLTKENHDFFGLLSSKVHPDFKGPVFNFEKQSGLGRRCRRSSKKARKSRGRKTRRR